MARRRKKHLRLTKKFPFIKFAGAKRHFSSCRTRLANIDRHLETAMKDADRRGYTRACCTARARCSMTRASRRSCISGTC